jgi:hypothetical protein
MSDSTNSYPYAGVRLHSLFADPRAPDLAVVHTGAHCWPERGGHPGEHGSLNAVQSRAPLLLSGSGVAARGVVERVARVVDIGATLAHVSGGSYDGMDGLPLPDVARGARYVVGLLWDGAQCADLLSLLTAGELPALSRLMDRGCAFRGGAIAEFPSVTLVNHTSALTGVGPGRHGIVNNAFYDRVLGELLGHLAQRDAVAAAGSDHRLRATPSWCAVGLRQRAGRRRCDVLDLRAVARERRRWGQPFVVPARRGRRPACDAGARGSER